MKIFAELHCHTEIKDKYGNMISDGDKPEKMIDAAIKNGVNCLAITDHNTLAGYYNCKKIVERYKKNKKIIERYPIIKNFFLIPGIEIKSKSGDILAYGLKRYVKRNQSIEKTIECILENKGVPVIAHPISFPNTAVTSVRIMELIPELEELLKEYGKKLGIEVYNDTSLFKYMDKWACGLAYKLIKEKPRYYFYTGGSDAHFPNKVGFVKTILKVKEISLDSILEAMQKPVNKIIAKESSFKERTALNVRNYIFSRQGISKLFNMVRDVDFKKGPFGLFF